VMLCVALFNSVLSPGDVDELNCAIGVAREMAIDTSRQSHRGQRELQELALQLQTVQCHLFDIGSSLATVPDPENPSKVCTTP
jgi:cob(I)alamin adenosyltransferase